MLAKMPVTKESILKVTKEIIDIIKMITHKHLVPFKKNKEKTKIIAKTAQITTIKSINIGTV